MGQASSSGFNGSSTAEQVAQNVNLQGKNVIITGCNTGIGLETARVMAKRGAHVIMACRDVKKANEAADTIRGEAAGGLEVAELDLASMASVRKFATEFNASNRPLHILINNAGVMACPYGTTKDGFEMQFGTNHLGHFLLTNLLLPRLKDGAPSRVVSVSSMGHAMAGINWDDLESKKSYWAWRAYGQSKTANILFAQEFNKRYSESGITAYGLHPGIIGNTDLGRHSSLYRVFDYFPSLGKGMEWVGVWKTVPQGAATQTYAATAPGLEAQGGKFFADCNLYTPYAHATRPEDASRLWEVSKGLVGL